MPLPSDSQLRTARHYDKCGANLLSLYKRFEITDSTLAAELGTLGVPTKWTNKMIREDKILAFMNSTHFQEQNKSDRATIRKHKLRILAIVKSKKRALRLRLSELSKVKLTCRRYKGK
jgi:hypothetical protein